MKLYVGNISYESTESALQAVFGEKGQVEEVVIITDRDTGRSRGFGFVTMPNDDEANTAIAELNGVEVNGRKLVVNQARERQPRY